MTTLPLQASPRADVDEATVKSARPRTGYDWLSIALHWSAAVAIIVLLFIGDSIATGGAETRNVHTTLALTCWLVLAFRVGWRWRNGHPPRLPSQGRTSFAIGSLVHHVMLIAIAVMLVSGPTAGLSSGAGLDVFDVHIGDPSMRHTALYNFARSAHITAATTLAITIGLHVAGVIKHIFIDRDGTLERMLTPRPRSPSTPVSGARDSV